MKRPGKPRFPWPPGPISDFDASGADHDTIDFFTLFNNRSNFTGFTVQQAFDQGDIFLVQQGGATTVKVDLNGGSHSDLDNDFDVVKLDGVSVANLDAQRNDLFLA